MSDNEYQKDYGPIDRLREASGIYELGFDQESMKGFMLPFIIVIGIGLPLGLLIWLWL
ncbi:MAG: hypothetical protein ACRDJH_15930 [Thermomicrobiales bacterium]